MIAMAIACEPALLIADEPTTALDVTVQAQILDLLRGLQAEQGMGIIMITHDLGVVADTAHRVVVMYAGRIVEEADVQTLFARPLHPYTIGLLQALPGAPTDDESDMPRLHEIKGQVPRILGQETGCNFSNRCSRAQERCVRESPPLADHGAGHKTACFFAEELVIS
jgi:oligopeptide/dipeptide ABC transporter ATP-binding protein